LGVVKAIDGDKIELKEDFTPGTVVAGDILVLVNSDEACLLEAGEAEDNEIDFIRGGRFTGPDGPPSGFPATGATVYNFRNVSLVTYYLDQTNNRLLMANHDKAVTAYDLPDIKSSVVANNIEDLQLFYFFNDELVDPTQVNDNPVISTNRLKNDSVKALALAMTSRADYGIGQSQNRFRPSLFNRASDGTGDNRARSTLSEYVYLRNYHN
jgi:hypothetical protein